MKLFLAAPESGLPSLLTALPAQASALHFFRKLVLAAPESALPSLPPALLSQDCAMAEPAALVVLLCACWMRFMSCPWCCVGPTNAGAAMLPVNALGVNRQPILRHGLRRIEVKHVAELMVINVKACAGPLHRPRSTRGR